MSQESKTFVIGTAGHVDHGKSTLVRALTGIDPDRLREEKEREMTIDLGFAWLKLPSGRQLSIVDVPGHERFIKNMLAGIGGIDAALLIVAADEGPMPQTDEHLAILDLLQIGRGIVALTKVDTVDDDWRDLVTEETRERLRGSSLERAPIIPVSAITGEGIEQLISGIDAILDDVPPHTESGRPRLPVDRVFTIQGFGTIVTGTLLGGPLDIGQEIEIQPSGLRARIRGLQSHREKVERATPGARTAVNLSGLAIEDIHRGDLLTPPGWITPTRVIDARLRMLPDSPVTLEQNDEVDFFVGSTETSARVTLLNNDRVSPGQEEWVQLRLSQPIATVSGDRFIVRQPSPSLTIGGGTVIDAHPRRHRRFRSEVINSLEILALGSPAEIVEQAIGNKPVELRQLLKQISLPEAVVRDALSDLIDDQAVTALWKGGVAAPLTPTTYLIRANALSALTEQIRSMLSSYHTRNPLRRGMAKEEIRSRLDLPSRAFEEIVNRAIEAGELAGQGDTLWLPDHRITFSAAQQERIDRYLHALQESPHTPPAPGEYGLEPEVAIALAETGDVVRIDDSVIFSRETFNQIRATVLEMIDAEGSITLSQFRDHFGSSRKYAQAVLEYLDQQRVTRRVGDERVRQSSG